MELTGTHQLKNGPFPVASPGTPLTDVLPYLAVRRPRNADRLTVRSIETTATERGTIRWKLVAA